MAHLLPNSLVVYLMSLLLLISRVYCDLPDGNCFFQGQSCEMHDNVLAIFPSVFSLEQCRLLCKNDPTCSYLTHYGNDNFPLSDTCVLFSTCSSLNTCNDCITADVACLPLDPVQLYSASLEGKIGQNLLQYLPDMANETECRTACVTVDNCNFYTYHLTTDPVYPGMCLLLNSLLEPITSCEHCKTGVLDISRTCSFLMDGVMFTSGLLITDTDNPISVELIALGTCELAVLAVGGGGSGFYDEDYSYGGGGGSGHIEYNTVNITAMATLRILVGAAWEKSVVQNVEDGTLIEAESGTNGKSSDGGLGYCGGGGSGSHSGSGSSGHGGTNGGYGENGAGGSGGSGSHVKVETIPMPNFILSPGKGGNGSGAHGGGGGGLLVNGKGAPGGHLGDGIGYGGGGLSKHEGKPGAVLLSYF